MQSYINDITDEFIILKEAIQKYYQREKNEDFNNLTARGKELIVSKLKETEEHLLWKRFLSQLKERFPDQIKSTTTSQEPSYSVEIQLENHQLPHLTNELKLVCSKSLFAPAYVIYGLEEVKIDREYDGAYKPYRFFGNLMKIVSPEGLIKPQFLLVKDMFSELFPSSKQVPFYLLDFKMRGLYLDNPLEESSVFDCLFRGLGQSHIMIHGNPYYAKEEWQEEQ